MKYYIILTACFVFGVTVLNSQCISGDCRNGTGIFVFNSGAKYIGQFANGFMEGVGSCYYSDGSKYQGQWKNGKPHGKGTKILANGTRQIGVWETGNLRPEQNKTEEREKVVTRHHRGCVSGDCRDGKGIYIYPSGAMYIGEFKSGEIHGVGVCYYSDGSKYQGEWLQRYPHGKGTKIYADGTKRSGMWKKGQPVDRNGNFLEETLTVQEEEEGHLEVQSGCLFGNCNNGQGTFAYADGSLYRGRFINGKQSGQGVFIYPNGTKYEGQFKEGFPHGRGKLIRSDKKVISGFWKNGEFEGIETDKFSGPGCVSGNCKIGNGTYVFKDGTKYVGEFLNGLPHGDGKGQYANGEIFEGQWAEGKFNGRGTLHLLDGTKVVGFWKDGVYMGTSNTSYHLQAQVSSEKPNRFSSPSTPMLGAQSKVWAVIIGVASYDHMPVLRYSDDDAYRLYAFLKSPSGGALEDEQVKVLIDEDATKQNIVQTMEYVFGKAGENDLVMVYFSGHGLRGAFLPIDFDGFNKRLLHEEINDIFKGSRAKYKLCIADACHSGSMSMARSIEVNEMLESYYSSLAKSEAGTALIMSSKSNETSLESSGLRQGVFSHFLIRGLKGEADYNSDKIINIQELFEFIQSNVRSYTGNRQSPVIKGMFDKKMTVSVRRK